MGRNNNEFNKIREAIKKEREVQYCTFHPKINNYYPSNLLNDQNRIFERLSSTSKLEKLKYFEAQKEARELEYCTFCPLLKNKEHHGRSQSMQADPVFSRLHRKGELHDQIRKAKALDHKGKELDGCTFSPQINVKQRVKSNSGKQPTEITERLYMDYERKRQCQAKNEIEHEQQEQAQCTFKPKIDSVSNHIQKENIVGDVPRYEMLYAKHQQKQQLLDQKRKELIEEEHRMHQLMTSARKVNNVPNTQISRRNPNKIMSTYARLLNSPFHAALGRNKEEYFSGKKDAKTEQVQAYERLHNLHKKRKSRQEGLIQKALQVLSYSFIHLLGARRHI
jgi:hypothetical protein